MSFSTQARLWFNLVGSLVFLLVTRDFEMFETFCNTATVLGELWRNMPKDMWVVPVFSLYPAGEDGIRLWLQHVYIQFL